LNPKPRPLVGGAFCYHPALKGLKHILTTEMVKLMTIYLKPSHLTSLLLVFDEVACVALVYQTLFGEVHHSELAGTSRDHGWYASPGDNNWNWHPDDLFRHAITTGIS
tara:strand:+ start:1279 stop:1602 length:324 start_codon:yes stop_codon:yes gene_type:complete